MALDFGYWSALTAPMQTAGQISERRDAEMLQAMQLMQQQKQFQLKQANDAKQMQSEIKIAEEATNTAIFQNNKYARQKDIDDSKNWHKEFSGWSDIQDVLTKYGSVSNARIHGNLDYLISEYKNKIGTISTYPTKGNPILERVNKNKTAITNYNTNFTSEEDKALIMSGDHERYQAWVNGETEYFDFRGTRGDYIGNIQAKYGVEENVNLDMIITHNQASIMSDFARDKNLTFEEVQKVDPYEIKSWLAKELQWSSEGGQQLFGGDALYCNLKIDTDFTTEINEAILGVEEIGMNTSDAWFDVRENGGSFEDIFSSSQSWLAFDRLGGYDHSTQVRDDRPIIDLDGNESGFINVGKGYKIVASGAIFANDKNMENAVIDALLNGESENPVYDSDSRKAHSMSTKGMYLPNGHQIDDGDLTNRSEANTWWWEEAAEQDMDYLSTHMAFKVVDKNGKSMLLTDVKSDSDFEKYKEQYKGQKLQPVMVAQFVERDVVTAGDYYYKEIDTNNPRIAEALNQVVDKDSMNRTRTQEINLEKKSKLRARTNKNIEASKQKLAVQMAAGDSKNFEVIANAYDENMTIGLKMAGVKTGKIQASMPLIMSNLYVNSQQPRTYPFTFKDGTTVQSPGQYMAVSARMIRKALTDGNDAGLKEAIEKGPTAYAAWLKGRYSQKDYNNIVKGTRDWTKHFNS